MTHWRSERDTDKVVEHFGVKRLSREYESVIDWSSSVGTGADLTPLPQNHKLAKGSSRHPLGQRPGTDSAFDDSGPSSDSGDPAFSARRSGSFELQCDLFTQTSAALESAADSTDADSADDVDRADADEARTGAGAARAGADDVPFVPQRPARPSPGPGERTLVDAGLVGLGSVIGNYRIIEQISKGGMGAVYRAEHTLLGRPAAIKVLLPEFCHNREFVKRFFNEAKALASIEHSGIVQVFDFGYHGTNSAYIVMELLDGESLRDRLLREITMSVGETLQVLREVAGVLAVAHEGGIIHRDLKPGNIFLVRDSTAASGYRAKVLDFGLAKLLSCDPDSAIQTHAGKLMGTPRYMSPEQCRTSRTIDHRTDVYALACVGFRMMCGRAPFEGSGYGDILAMQIKTPPLPPSVIEPMIPPEVDALILRALSKDPAGRHSDMRAMSREIDAILAQYDAVLETSASSRRRASTGGLRPNDIVDRWEQELDTPSVVIGLSPEDEDVDIHVDADVDFDIDVDVEDEDEDEDEDGPKTAVQTPARMLAEAARRRRRAKSQSAPLPTRAPTAEPPRVPAKARSAAAPPQSSGSRTRAPRVDQSVAARVGGEPEIIAIDIGEAAFLAREAGAAAVVEDRRAVPWFALALFALVLLGTLLGISLR